MDDKIDLVRQLCVGAGMIMEDASVEAVSAHRDPDALHRAVERLGTAAEAISALAHAAAVLVRIV
jgi:phosphoribosylcarboxyaminoimidazole (NCAIR) mutase